VVDKLNENIKYRTKKKEV